MKKNETPYITILDIGTSALRIVVIENQHDKKIVAATTVPIDYIKKGIVTDTDALTQSIRVAISQIHKIYLGNIQHVVVTLSGMAVGSISNRAEVIIHDKTYTIAEKHIQEIYQKVEERIPSSIIQNKTIIHTIPQEFRIDGKKISDLNPIGFQGKHLDLKALCVYITKQQLDTILCACEEADLRVDDVVISEYATTNIYIKESLKLAGVCVVNIGADTTTVITYDEGVPLLLDVFPIGSQDITKDLALGLKISLTEAEDIKLKPEKGLRHLASELTEVLIKKQNISIKKEQRVHALYMSLDERYHEIVYARLIDIFELVQQHVRKIKKDKLLPGGVMIHGGGSRIEDVAVIAKEILHLPSQILPDIQTYTQACKHKHSEHHIHISDCLSTYMSGIFYLTEDEHIYQTLKTYNTQSFFKKIIEWCKQFLP